MLIFFLVFEFFGDFVFIVVFISFFVRIFLGKFLWVRGLLFIGFSDWVMFKGNLNFFKMDLGGKFFSNKLYFEEGFFFSVIILGRWKIWVVGIVKLIIIFMWVFFWLFFNNFNLEVSGYLKIKFFKFNFGRYFCFCKNDSLFRGDFIFVN